MKKRNINSFNLEKKAGLKLGTVNSIISGRTRSPKITTLIALANILESSIDEIVGFSVSTKSNSEEDSDIDSLEWNSILANKCLQLITLICSNQKKNINNKHAETIYRTLYTLCIRKFLNYKKDNSVDISEIEPDPTYAEWLIAHISKNF